MVLEACVSLASVRHEGGPVMDVLWNSVGLEVGITGLPMAKSSGWITPFHGSYGYSVPLNDPYYGWKFKVLPSSSRRDGWL